MKIIIIGSKGFIGSACYRYFTAKQGYDVFGADVVVEYNNPKYFLIDATNADFRPVFKNQKFDWCINCAGAASVPDSIKNPLRDYLLNVHHLALLLNAIKEENMGCRLIQLSSAAVYGNPDSLPITEEHPTAPISPYGIHKKQAEELCALYYNLFGINSYVLRIFSAYGPGLKKQVFWDLYKKSESQSNVTLFGTGKETREFIHVSDIANAIEVIMLNIPPGHRLVNVANSDAITIEVAAKLFLENMGFKGAATFNAINRTGDPLFWQADTSLLKSIGYKPVMNLEEGIINYCKWLKEEGSL